MIPMIDLAGEYQSIKKEIDRTINEVLKSGCFILGPKVKEFEKKFAQYLGVKYAVGVASGTEALQLALLAAGVEPGDGVILPANVYPTIFAVSAVGAVPQLVDINPENFNLDAPKIKPAITKKTKAIIPVHLYGQPAEMDSILAVAEKYGLAVVEDCAQAHGAVYKGKKVGLFGDLGCFSFYPTKPLAAYGDGGMVVTNRRELAEKAKILRMYGEKKRYQSIVPGFNSRLDELQAAILLVKLKYLDRWSEKRRRAATYYQKLLAGLGAILPREQSFTKHVWHLFVIRAKKRNQLQKFLEKKGIVTGIHYPAPIHLQPAYQNLGYQKGDFPQSEKASLEVLSLPLYLGISRKQQKFVTGQIFKFYKKN